jgi:hypothetical protein
MSQSDYIKYKRVATQLYLDASYNQTPVFTSQNYLDYEQFALENTVQNWSNNYSLMTPSGEQIVFNMEKRTTGCPAFLICKNTNRRPNRIPLPSVYFTPTPQPLNWEQKKNASWLKNGCICNLDSVKTLRYICKCKTSF